LTPELDGTFRNFTTPRYSMHIMEILTGLKFVLITTPKKVDHQETLQHAYKYLFVPFVSGNIFLAPGAKVESKLFDQKLAEFLLSK